MSISKYRRLMFGHGVSPENGFPALETICMSLASHSDAALVDVLVPLRDGIGLKVDPRWVSNATHKLMAYMGFEPDLVNGMFVLRTTETC